MANGERSEISEAGVGGADTGGADGLVRGNAMPSIADEAVRAPSLTPPALTPYSLNPLLRLDGGAETVDIVAGGRIAGSALRRPAGVRLGGMPTSAYSF